MKLWDQFIPDGYGTIRIGQYGGWWVEICPMLYNDRLVLTPESNPLVYDYGWCYDKGPQALIAAHCWDPHTHGEPPGFKKRVGDHKRWPGETAKGFHP